MAGFQVHDAADMKGPSVAFDMAPTSGEAFVPSAGQWYGYTGSYTWLMGRASLILLIGR